MLLTGVCTLENEILNVIFEYFFVKFLHKKLTQKFLTKLLF